MDNVTEATDFLKKMHPIKDTIAIHNTNCEKQFEALAVRLRSQLATHARQMLETNVAVLSAACEGL